jgi:hypothetical protein
MAIKRPAGRNRPCSLADADRLQFHFARGRYLAKQDGFPGIRLGDVLWPAIRQLGHDGIAFGHHL